MNKLSFFLAFLLILVLPGAGNADNTLEQIPVLIHVSSNISDGRYAPEEIVAIAQEQGFKTVVFTDRFNMRWEYGIRPWRNLLKRSVTNRSVLSYGVEKYLRRIKEIQQAYPQMTVIPGVEVIPFYYWGGSLFKGNLTLFDDHKHLLVIGLEDGGILKKLPVIHNDFVSKGFSGIFWTILSLAIMFSGTSLLVGSGKKNYRNSLEKAQDRKKRWIAVVLILIGVLSGINNFSISSSMTFDPYHSRGILPYQRVIDFAAKHNALTFWAHPESEYYLKTDRVTVVTKEHSQDLVAAKNYTGFSIFYEGYEKIGKPGGLWDKILLEYIEGKREQPVWAIAGLAFDYEGDLRERGRDLRNIVLAQDNGKAALLEGLSRGRVYVLRGADSAKLKLIDFSLRDGKTGRESLIGQTLELNSDQLLVHVRADTESAEKDAVIKLIKNGQVIINIESQFPLELSLPEDTFIGPQAFYRLEIITKNAALITNPIFVKSKE